MMDVPPSIMSSPTSKDQERLRRPFSRESHVSFADSTSGELPSGSEAPPYRHEAPFRPAVHDNVTPERGISSYDSSPFLSYGAGSRGVTLGDSHAFTEYVDLHEFQGELPGNHVYYEPRHSGPLKKIRWAEEDENYVDERPMEAEAEEIEIAHLTETMERLDSRARRRLLSKGIGMRPTQLMRCPFSIERSPLTRFGNLIMCPLEVPKPRRFPYDIDGANDEGEDGTGANQTKILNYLHPMKDTRYSMPISSTRGLRKAKTPGWRSSLASTYDTMSPELAAMKLVTIPALNLRAKLSCDRAAQLRPSTSSGYSVSDAIAGKGKSSTESAEVLLEVDMDTLLMLHFPLAPKSYFCKWRDLQNCYDILGACPGVGVMVAGGGGNDMLTSNKVVRSAADNASTSKRPSTQLVGSGVVKRESVKFVKAPDQLSCNLCLAPILKKADHKLFFKCRRCQAGSGRYCMCNQCYGRILTDMKSMHYANGHQLLENNCFKDYTNACIAYSEEIMEQERIRSKNRTTRIYCKVCLACIRPGEIMSVCTICRAKGVMFQKCHKCRNYFQPYKVKVST